MILECSRCPKTGPEGEDSVDSVRLWFRQAPTCHGVSEWPGGLRRRMYLPRARRLAGGSAVTSTKSRREFQVWQVSPRTANANG